MGLFKKKVFKLKEKEYGYLLSKMIMTSTKNGFAEISDSFSESDDKLINFLELSLHYTYICECLLKEKYSSLKVDRCINHTIENLAIQIGAFDDKVDEGATLLLNLYTCIKEAEINIFTEEGLHQLAQSYQDSCEIGYDQLLHLTIFLLLSNFIIHHTADIAGEQLCLI